jgi:hypothetical protein
MNDSFKNHTLKIFSDTNRIVLGKFNSLESKEIEKNMNNIVRLEDSFNEIEAKLDSAVNNIIRLKMNKEISKELNFIN